MRLQNDGNLVLYHGRNSRWATNTDTSSHRDTWMQDQIDTIGHRRLRDVAIVGSHDAGMSTINGQTKFAEACNTITQTQDIFVQLRFGARYFDIRPVIGNNGQWLTGHYGLVKQGPIKTWQGANGQSIDSVIEQVNRFTAGTRELVILNFSHDLQTDQKYRRLNDQEWEQLLEQLKRLKHLYIEKPGANTDQTLDHRTVSHFIGTKANPRPAVLAIIHGPEAVVKKYNKYGMYHKSRFDIFDKFSETNDFRKMADHQFAQMREFSRDKMFLLSWTLTQGSKQASTCSLRADSDPRGFIGHAVADAYDKFLTDVADIDDKDTRSILDLALIANRRLNSFLAANVTKQHFPNIIYLDRIDDPRGADAAIRVNNWIQRPDQPKHFAGIRAGGQLHHNEFLQSQNKAYRLIMQSDGNLVLYRLFDSAAVWSTNTKTAFSAVLQNDGNFVLHDRNGHVVWASNSSAGPNSRLVLQDDQNLVIYDSQGKASWHSNTHIR